MTRREKILRDREKEYEDDPLLTLGFGKNRYRWDEEDEDAEEKRDAQITDTLREWIQ